MRKIYEHAKNIPARMRKDEDLIITKRSHGTIYIRQRNITYGNIILLSSRPR